MNWDALIYWMSQIGEGSWAGFRRAVAELAGGDADAAELSRALRVFLSDLGHADFFIDASQTWRMLSPALAGAASQAGTAFLIGARSPDLTRRLQDSAQHHGARVEILHTDERPCRIFVVAAPEAMNSVAADAGLPYTQHYSASRIASVPLIRSILENAVEEPEAPVNWAVSSFDLNRLKWVEGLLPRSACEYKSHYEARRFFLHKRSGHLLQMSKREAVYGAAVLQSVELASYDQGAYTLSTPIEAPLPEALTRTACLCSGEPARLEGRRLVYCGVPPSVGFALLVAAGQPHPLIQREPLPWSLSRGQSV
ncbi:MAG: hypothetical protein ABSH47_20730 [Bryobacteraceae bacterium]